MYYKKTIGNFGEDMASKYLLKNSYKIIARNIKISHQEIDIIAINKEIIVFFEVKTRNIFSKLSGEEAIDAKKIKNIKKAIQAYIKIHNLDLDRAQFDVITVNINQERRIANIKHYIKIF